MKPIAHEIGPRAHGAMVAEIVATREGPATTARLLAERVRVGTIRGTPLTTKSHAGGCSNPAWCGCFVGVHRMLQHPPECEGCWNVPDDRVQL